MGNPIFGVGILSINPQVITTTTSPVQAGTLTECTIDQSFDMVELYGSESDPIDVAPGKRKTVIKGKFASFSSDIYAAFMGTAATTGMLNPNINEQFTIPTTPYTVTVANGATWERDLGVIDATTGLAMSRVASAPATGQYSASAAGVYVFAAADVAHVVLISYTNTVAGSGKSVTINGQQMGAGSVFQVDLFQVYKSKAQGIRFPAVRFSKVSQAFKNVDHGQMDFEAVAFKDPTSNMLCKSIFAV
jgi:hypothetical protein